ncbi:hypothetical protein IAT38_001342 [Cryptococcus sp. DSM 104549]
MAKLFEKLAQKLKRKGSSTTSTAPSSTPSTTATTSTSTKPTRASTPRRTSTNPLSSSFTTVSKPALPTTSSTIPTTSLPSSSPAIQYAAPTFFQRIRRHPRFSRSLAATPDDDAPAHTPPSNKRLSAISHAPPIGLETIREDKELEEEWVGWRSVGSRSPARGTKSGGWRMGSLGSMGSMGRKTVPVYTDSGALMREENSTAERIPTPSTPTPSTGSDIMWPPTPPTPRPTSPEHLALTLEPTTPTTQLPDTAATTAQPTTPDPRPLINMGIGDSPWVWVPARAVSDRSGQSAEAVVVKEDEAGVKEVGEVGVPVTPVQRGRSRSVRVRATPEIKVFRQMEGRFIDWSVLDDMEHEECHPRLSQASSSAATLSTLTLQTPRTSAASTPATSVEDLLDALLATVGDDYDDSADAVVNAEDSYCAGDTTFTSLLGLYTGHEEKEEEETDSVNSSYSTDEIEPPSFVLDAGISAVARRSYASDGAIDRRHPHSHLTQPQLHHYEAPLGEQAVALIKEQAACSMAAVARGNRGATVYLGMEGERATSLYKRGSVGVEFGAKSGPVLIRLMSSLSPSEKAIRRKYPCYL